MKKILIIAGPNGAGKTTFAKEVLPKEAHCLEFVNADLIAAGLSPFQRRFDRGLANLRDHYLAAVDGWAIYDGSQQPPLLLDSDTNTAPPTLMEDPAPYPSDAGEHDPATVFSDPDFIGAEAAMKRASAKAVAQARAAGLEPVVWNPAVDGPGLVPEKWQHD